MNGYTKDILDVWNELTVRNLNKYVFMSRGKLTLLASKHAKDIFLIPDWSYHGVYAKRHNVFVEQILFGNCFELPREYAFELFRKIYEYFGEQSIISRDFGKHVRSPEAMARFFEGVNEIPSPELKQQRGLSFVDELERKYGGNPLNIVDEATVYDKDLRRNVLYAFNGGRGLVELLTTDFGSAYADTEILSINIPTEDGVLRRNFFLNFYKQAQLVVLMIHGRAVASRGHLPEFADIDEVGPVADYELSRAFRRLEVFEYSEELSEKVDNWREILQGSEMEMEIRMATVAACLALLDAINSERAHCKLPKINMAHLDFWLRNIGKGNAN